MNGVGTKVHLGTMGRRMLRRMAWRSMDRSHYLLSDSYWERRKHVGMHGMKKDSPGARFSTLSLVWDADVSVCFDGLRSVCSIVDSSFDDVEGFNILQCALWSASTDDPDHNPSPRRSTFTTRAVNHRVHERGSHVEATAIVRSTEAVMTPHAIRIHQSSTELIQNGLAKVEDSLERTPAEYVARLTRLNSLLRLQMAD